VHAHTCGARERPSGCGPREARETGASGREAKYIYMRIKRRLGDMRNEYMPERDTTPPKKDYMPEAEASTHRAVAAVTARMLTYVCSRTYADDVDVC
jgi:hypothetical protein